MKLRSSTSLISFGLACLTFSLVLLAHSLGIAPDQGQPLLRARMQSAELIAAQCSPVAAENDLATLKSIVLHVASANSDLASAGIRNTKGTLLYAYNDHASLWADDKSSSAPGMKLSVPIITANGEWGSIELCFRKDNIAMPHFVPQAVTSFISNPAMRVGGFIFAAGFLAYSFYLGRTLRQLDPSSVIPPRVRAMLDSLTEGVVVLDTSGRIVLANESFAECTGQSTQNLQGREVGELKWTDPRSQEPAEVLPWMSVLGNGHAAKGITLCLHAAHGEISGDAENRPRAETALKRVFSVNAAPVLGPAGMVRGALVTFDDVTEVENMNLALRESRDEVQRWNQQLNILATIDPMTECLNRRSFIARFEEQFARLDTLKGSVGCVMVDVDRFKSINDRFGHTTGDVVLKEVARILRSNVGLDDHVCRYGGEEFCILLPGRSAADSETIAERLRLAIESEKWVSTPVTASFGVSASDLGAPDVKTLLDQADSSLYVSKRSGRNRVTCWGRTISDPADLNGAITANNDIMIPQSLVEPTQQASFLAMITTFAYQRPETAIHCRRVADWCLLAAPGLLSAQDAAELEVAALLHDIGKVGIPDAILLKPGPLTPEEWEVMRSHDQIGVDITTAAGIPWPAVHIIAAHHSKYTPPPDSAPAQLDPVRVAARLLTIGDAFDAMISDRPYRKAMSWEDAFAELRRCSGTMFDPTIVEHFIAAVTQKGAGKSGQPRHAA